MRTPVALHFAAMRISPRKRDRCRWASWLCAWAAVAGAVSANAQDFPACIDALASQAEAAGVGERGLSALRRVERLPRVIELDRRQPEFQQTFSAYLTSRVSATRVATGRLMLASYRPLLERLTREYGVPGRYLVAFWGLETNYGGYLGRMPTLDSLATLACDQRRRDFFTAELLTALKVLERERLDPETFRGSWAGAVGHTQFMPSTYANHAVDGDGDGRIDLWNSVDDALTSAADYLQGLGWQRGQRWGREVRLPDDFEYLRTGLEQRRPLADWRAMGVTTASGEPLPAGDFEAAVIVPMGHRGPAFLVYPNFEVILEWNRSQSYALSVGYLADRIAGGGGLVAELPDVEKRLAKAQVRRLQERLADLGFDPGEPDGLIGPATRGALRAWQSLNGKVADGYPDEATLRELGVQ